MSSLRRIAWRLAAGVCGAAAAHLALTHPVAPFAATTLALLACAAAWRRPALWLWLLPACLPWLNFSPWTGWTVVDEFDLLLLAVCAAGYARRGSEPGHFDDTGPTGRQAQAPGVLAALPWLFLAWTLLSLLALWRGWVDAGGGPWDPFADAVDAGNSLRVGKSLLAVWLCLPLLWQACVDDLDRTWRRMATGLCIGLAVLGLAVLWERAAFPGLSNFESVYRVSGLFWEMHVGGSAIDAYLSMGLPFVLWAALRVRGLAARAGALLLLVLLLHALMATASRLALAGALAASLVWLLWGWRSVPGLPARSRLWPWLLGLALASALAGLTALVASQDSFLAFRLRTTQQVWEQRLLHWQDALGVASEPAEAWLGIGLGRFPARYSNSVEDAGMPGAARAATQQDEDGTIQSYVMLRGPDDADDKAGRFALTQRIRPMPEARYLVAGRYRAPDDAAVLLRVCERHLLYDRHCQTALLEVPGGDLDWHPFSLPLEGDRFQAPARWAPRLGMFSVSVLTPGAQVDLSGLVLQDGAETQQLVNGDFRRGMARWFPAVQFYFLPWHADSLWMEILLERGLLALATAVALASLACLRLVRLRRHEPALAACLAGSLAGALVVGLGASLLDVPRIAFLAQFLLLFAVLAARRAADAGQARPAMRGGAPLSV